MQDELIQRDWKIRFFPPGRVSKGKYFIAGIKIQYMYIHYALDKKKYL